MALPILDGNQTAATLSTIITGGAHIPAHTVVSLGSQAISDITSGVSGSVVSISNFPSTQTVAGTVTANVPISDISGGIADYISGTDSFVVSPLSGVTFPISGTVTANTAYATSVTGNAGLTPAVVTAMPVALVDRGIYGGGIMSYDGSNTSLNVNVKGSLPTISGTVTANVANVVTINSSGASFSQRVVSKSDLQFTAIAGAIDTTKFSGDYTVLPVKITSETDGLNLAVDLRKTVQGNDLSAISNDATAAFVRTQVVGGSVTIGSLPNGALTTRFGSVTTANTAQITSAVTNTSRKYLLAQNISAGTVTIGIGFSPTTTQGIQLTAGGGLTFDAFCPTGAVYWLGAVTGADFTILEG